MSSKSYTVVHSEHSQNTTFTKSGVQRSIRLDTVSIPPWPDALAGLLGRTPWPDALPPHLTGRLTARRHLVERRGLQNQILSKGIGTTKIGMFEDELPDVYIRGAGLYKAKLNAENPIGTIQSIEHAIRSFDSSAEDEEMRIAKLEKTLKDYKEQAGKPFEHEAKLKELVLQQKELNAALDLDKNAQQVAEAASSEGASTEPEAVSGHVGRLAARGERSLRVR
jgi:hypothetical protein